MPAIWVLLLLGCISCGVVRNVRSEPDVNLVFFNNCTYPIRFMWDENIGGPSPNVLVLYNQRLSSGSSDSVVVQSAKMAGGRVYVQSADDSNGSTTAECLPKADVEDALRLFSNGDGEALRAQYSKYLIAGEPRAWAGSIAPPGQLVEMTITHDGGHIYDADVSNVFYFNGPVSVEMLYANGYQAIDKFNCRNTSNRGIPDQSSCEQHGGVWIPYPRASHGPPGLCESPNIVCIGQSTLPACRRFDNELAPLMNFLDANKVATGYSPQLGASIPHTTRMYTCDGFLNSPQLGFLLASTCAALNRGQCSMPTGDDLGSVDDFKSWVANKCGNTQFENQGAVTWFKQPVRNPWAEYIRGTLASNTYAFAQDEGPFGGNAQCHASGAPLNWSAPSGMRITACPGYIPAPAPPSSRQTSVAPPQQPPPPSPPPAPSAPPGTCKVGDTVPCPGARSNCTGLQCCGDGTTCPSAPDFFHACPRPKQFDCTKPSETFV